MKKGLSFLLASLLAVSAFPFSAAADTVAAGDVHEHISCEDSESEHCTYECEVKDHIHMYDEGEAVECPHTNTETVDEKAPTCTEDGYTGNLYCNDCGNVVTYGETDPMLGHDYKETDRKEPDCQNDGYIKKTCENCSDEISEPIASTGSEHNIETTIVPPTCTEDGYTLKKCTVDGCTYEEKTDAVTSEGHKWNTWEVNAETHAEKCSVCGATAEPAEHSYTNGVCVCGYGCDHSFDAWESDAEGHYKVCSNCSSSTNKTPHSFEGGKCTECEYICAHIWGDWQTVTESTCTSQGVQTRSCTACGASETVDKALAEHSYTSEIIPPTCVDGGYTIYTCTVCGDVYEGEPTEPLGHSFGDWQTVVDSTCTEKGSKTRTCTVCNLTENGDIAEKGHSYNTEVIAPSCTEGGCTVYTCSVCEHTYTDDETSATGHSFDEWATDASTHTEKCSVCKALGESGNHIYDGNGQCTVCQYGCAHSGVSLKNNSEPTCTAEGYTGDEYCDACGCLVTKGETIPVIPHSWSDWKNTEHEHYKECTVCSAESERGAHTFDNAVCSTCAYACAHPNKEIKDDKAPTCSSLGYTGDTYCTVCGEKVGTGADIPMLPHTWGDWEYDGVNGHFKSCTDCTAVTDTEAHVYENGKCGICNYACLHTFGDWQTVTDSTCTQKGTKKRICTVCALEQTDVIAEKGHDYKAVVTPPTCTAKGYTTHTCTRCSDSYVDSYVNALGHSFGDWITVKDSTCLEKGTKKKVCSVCSFEEFADINAKGHNYVSTVVPPTCTEKGYTHYDCSRCDSEYDDKYVDALGHSWSEWETIKQPTFFENGELKRTCTACAAIEKKSIPMNEDHTPPKATIVIGDHTWESFVDGISFNTFFKEIVSVTVTAEDIGTSLKDTSGVMSIQYYQSVNVYTKDQLKNINGWKSIKNVDRGGSFPIATDGEFIVYVRVTDQVGNVAYFSTDGFVIDRVVPGITGNGIGEDDTELAFCGEVSFTVSDDYLANVYINGVSQEFTGKSCTITLPPASTKYEIVVEDAAGNARAVVISVNSDHVKGDAATCTAPQVCTICGTVIKEALGHRWGSWTVTKEATAKEYGEEQRKCSRCGATEKRRTPKLEFPTQFTSSVYTYSATEGIVTGVAAQTTIEAFLSQMDNSEYIRVFGIDTKEITDKTKTVTTGMKIKLMENDTSYSAEATIVIKGDVNSDGKTNITDVVRTNFHCLGNGVTLLGAELKAADFNGDGKVNITDVVQMNLKNLGVI